MKELTDTLSKFSATLEESRRCIEVLSEKIAPENVLSGQEKRRNRRKTQKSKKS